MGVHMKNDVTRIVIKYMYCMIGWMMIIRSVACSFEKMYMPLQYLLLFRVHG